MFKIWKISLPFLILLLLGGCERKDGVILETMQERVTEKADEILSEAEKAPTWIYVDVCGAVMNPGVVRVDADARVFQAIEEAGGFTKEADVKSVNQAAVLEDGQQITVYTVEEWAEGQNAYSEGGPAADQGKVNINTATAEELTTLSGIGASRASDIIAYRESNGGFQTIQDIMKVSGIKDAVFQKIKDKIKV